MASKVAYYTTKLNKSGVSFLEVIVIALLCSAFLRLAIPNINEFLFRAHDALAKKVYLSLKEKFFSTKNISVFDKPVVFLNQQGPAKIFIHSSLVEIPKDITINYAIEIPNSKGGQVLFEVTHNNGSQRFRYISIDGEIIEQVTAL